MTVELKDKAGNTLKKGDYIVYGHNLGRCAALRYGIIVDIYEPKKDWGEKKTHLRIRGVDYEGWKGEPELLSKDSTLQFGDRTLRISSAQIPIKVVDLLNAYAKEKGL